MADEDLKKRLHEHSKAFEGLMDLVPAEYYYGKDNSEQWQRKKQTKEEKRAAKKAKLEPGAYKSALDVHREREREHLKRKRELEGEFVEAVEADSQKEEAATEKPPKKPKLDKDEKKALKEERRKALDPEQDEAIRQEKADKRKEQNRRKKEAKREQKQRVKDKRKAKKEKSRETDSSAVQDLEGGALHAGDKQLPPSNTKRPSKPEESKPSSARRSEKNGRKDHKDVEAEAFEGFEEEDDDDDDDDASSVSSSPEQENLFDNSTNHSSASSSSSIVPPSDPSTTEGKQKQTSKMDMTKRDNEDEASSSSESGEGSEVEPSKSKQLGDRIALPLDPETEEESTNGAPSKSKPGDPLKPNSTYTEPTDTVKSTEPSNTTEATDQLPKIDREALTKRLSEKLAAYRAARKADGPDGKPAKNRAELIEARRRKEELRKQRKKEQRAKEREAKDAETEAARLRGGNGSPLWSPSVYSPGGALANQSEPNLQFGRVAFEDGAEVDVEKGTIKDKKKKKGPSDTKTALVAAEAKKAKMAGHDAAKRADIEEREAWRHAGQRVAGEKRKDDPSLLKKALKRKEKLKNKSEKAWNERLEGVKKSQEMRQKKREDNLRKRKEEKGIKGKDRKKMLGKVKGKDGSPKQKQRKRPGFEGSFKSSAKRT